MHVCTVFIYSSDLVSSTQQQQPKMLSVPKHQLRCRQEMNCKAFRHELPYQYGGEAEILESSSPSFQHFSATPRGECFTELKTFC